MDTEAQGARVVREKQEQGESSWYRPEIKIAGVWLPVQRNDYEPRDFRSCVECAVRAARNEPEAGEEVVWAVEEFEVAGELGVAHTITADLEDETEAALRASRHEDDQPLVRVVLVPDWVLGEAFSSFVVQMRVGDVWIGEELFSNRNAAIKLAQQCLERLVTSERDEAADRVVWEG